MLRFSHIFALFCAFLIVEGSRRAFKDSTVYVIESSVDNKALTVKNDDYNGNKHIELDTFSDDRSGHSSPKWLAIEQEDNRFILVTTNQNWFFAKTVHSFAKKVELNDLPPTLIMTANTKSNSVTLDLADRKTDQLWQTIKSTASDYDILLKNVVTNNCLVNPVDSNRPQVKECDPSDRAQMWKLYKRRFRDLFF